MPSHRQLLPVAGLTVLMSACHNLPRSAVTPSESERGVATVLDARPSTTSAQVMRGDSIMQTNINLATVQKNRITESDGIIARASGQTTLVGGIGAIITGAITNTKVAKWVGAGVAAATAIIGYRATSAGATTALRTCTQAFAPMQMGWEIAKTKDSATVSAGFDAMIRGLGELSQKPGCDQYAPDLTP